MANVEKTRSVAPSRNGKKLVVRGYSKGHLPGVATPAWLRSSRVFASENSRSSYVTGSRGRCYGEVTMREDSCRLSDATSDKYQCTALFPTDSPSRVVRGSFAEASFAARETRTRLAPWVFLSPKATAGKSDKSHCSILTSQFNNLKLKLCFYLTLRLNVYILGDFD